MKLYINLLYVPFSLHPDYSDFILNPLDKSERTSHNIKNQFVKKCIDILLQQK